MAKMDLFIASKCALKINIYAWNAHVNVYLYHGR